MCRTTSTIPAFRSPTWWLDFMHIEKKSLRKSSNWPPAAFRLLLLGSCTRGLSQWYEQDPENKKTGCRTLHEIEEGGNETAAMAETISIAVLRRHLETMDRLDIEYDFLPRESEILHLHFWDAAFAKLKAAGVLNFEMKGRIKAAG